MVSNVNGPVCGVSPPTHCPIQTPEVIEMDRFQQLAGSIIDEVIDAVLEQNPEIDTSKKEGNLGSPSARKREEEQDLGSPSARKSRILRRL